jgi:hypothetical protein
MAVTAVVEPVDAALRDMVEGLTAIDIPQLAELTADYEFRRDLATRCEQLVAAAYEQHDPAAISQLHDTLVFIYEQDFGAPTVEQVDRETQPILRDVAARLEQAVLAHELAAIPPELITDYPTEGRAYVHWLKRIVGDHPASRHPFYNSYLVERASPDCIRFFLAQETNLDPRFDDILALMQVGVTGPEKMEIANNYYDEMGCGIPADVHTAMFADTLRCMRIDPSYVAANLLPEAKISGNLSACLALSRRHYFKATGYFGVTEYLAPRRFRRLTSAWQRLGLPPAGIRYHDLHVGIDAGHAAGWFQNVIAPAVEQDPRVGREIAAGAVIRLNSSQQYLDALQSHLERATPAG